MGHFGLEKLKLDNMIKIGFYGGMNMTVRELYMLCEKQIENGKEYNEIILCTDDDRFIFLESGFSSPVYNDSAIYDLLEDCDMEEDEVVVLN